MKNLAEFRPLLERYPNLKKALPHVALGNLPTPVEQLKHLEESLGANAPDLFIKRDDLSGAPYGGNKVRKLEFLLARALREGRKEVLTFGAAGSNHALATALYARRLGLGCISMLVPQPNATSVRRNLLMSCKAGAELHHSAGMPAAAAATLLELLEHRIGTGRLPYLIPPGGSSATGVVGFVNAGFELREQVEAGVLPEPDYLYAASGTMGTVVGLALGLRAAGLRTRIMAVRVTDPEYTSISKAQRLFAKVNALLHDADSAFPIYAFPADRFQFRHEFFGQAYALYTEEGVRAVQRLKDAEGIKTEGTYTGKALAALLADIKSGILRGKTVLFWHTYNAWDFGAEIANLDYRALPKAFHRYFEEDVQPLDR